MGVTDISVDEGASRQLLTKQGQLADGRKR